MKKKSIVLLFVITLIGMLSFKTNVYAGNINCAALPENVVIDESIADIVHTIIVAIQIAVPVILVIFGMLDLMKGVMAQKEDEIKKGQQIFIKRLIAAVLVFFVIAVVKFAISFVAKDSDGVLACANCFIQGSSDPSCSTPTE